VHSPGAAALPPRRLDTLVIELADITLRRGERLLFEGLNLRIHAGFRVGLVGRNGVGKSSLFALLRGQLAPELGDVRVPPRWQIGYMAQESDPSTLPALEWVQLGDARIAEIRRALAAAEARHDGEAQARWLADFEDADGYTLEARAAEILSGLGFAATDFAKPQQDFSGGWRIRLDLARTLLTRADLLLLDEPTNHLDLDALLWLESWLSRFDGTLVIIAHDRDFLDAVTDHIVHLEGTLATLYRGNYSAFERARSEHLARQAALARKQEREARHIREFVERFRAKASKARQVQSRIKALERMGQTVVAQVDSPYRFDLPGPERMSKCLLETEAATFGYGTTAVLREVRFRIAPADRIGILGHNGAGKSTFVKTLAGELAPLTGSLKSGAHARIGYFAQHQLENLDGEATPLAALLRADPAGRPQALRNHLGGWGFPGAMVDQRIRTLSGGEKARLVLALIAWQRPALLLLDEPTNHLDLDMRHALAVALEEFPGAVVLVSHDREFMARTVDAFWLADQGRIVVYRGDLESYVAELRTPPTSAPRARSAPSRRERRQSAAEARRETEVLRKRVRAAERRMEALGRELGALRARLGDPATYETLLGSDLSALVAEEGRLARALDAAEAEWLTHQSALEAVDAADATG
jgi:ATP-binding cassette subfamily F protein 3